MITFSAIVKDKNGIPYQEAQANGLSIRKYPKNYLVARKTVEEDLYGDPYILSMVIAKVPVGKEQLLEETVTELGSKE